MIKNYFEIDGETSIAAFLKDFNEKKNSHYIILKDEESPSFVDMRSIALKVSDSNEKVKNFRKPLFESSADNDLDHALNLIECGDRVILTEEGYFDFVDALRQIQEDGDFDFLNSKVSSIERKDLYALNKDDKISTARGLVVKNKINLLPVIDDLKVLGEVRTRDFLVSGLYSKEGFNSNADYFNQNYTESTANLPVLNIMNEKPHSIHKNSTIRDAVKLMVDKGLPSLIVKDDDEIYSVISYKDIFKLVKKDSKSKSYSIEFAGASNLYEDEFEAVETYAEKLMEKVSKMSNYDSLRVTLKSVGNTEGTHQRKMSVKALLSQGNKVLTVDKEISAGTNDSEYNDKNKGKWNSVAMIQNVFSALEKKVRDEKKKKK